MKEIPEGSVDLIVTDPPYGLKFMGKNWDKAVPAVDVWKECLRVLKPGAFAFIMCSPRQDCLSQMIVRLQEAGFDTNFTSLYWTYASGFPKAYNVANGVEGKLKLGTANWSEWKNLEGEKAKNNLGYSKLQHLQEYREKNYQGTARNISVHLTTKEAKKYQGSYAGFQPKPALEVIIVAMKPMNENSFTEQALKNGKGLTWMDDCRIPYSSEKEKWGNKGGVVWSPERKWNHAAKRTSKEKGRFPANLLVSDEILDDGKKHAGGGVGGRAKHGRGEGYGFKPEGPNAPILPKDTGGYSRFFSLDSWAEKNLPFLIAPKASKKEKNIGLGSAEEKRVGDGRKKTNDTPFQRGKTLRKNTHPTVKPIKLMAYLITMGSREGDVVLDPFAGSGTTCIAARMLRRRFIGIEVDPQYHRIAEARMENAALAMAA